MMRPMCYGCWKLDAIRDEGVHTKLLRQSENGVNVLRIDDDVARLSSSADSNTAATRRLSDSENSLTASSFAFEALPEKATQACGSVSTS